MSYPTRLPGAVVGLLIMLQYEAEHQRRQAPAPARDQDDLQRVADELLATGRDGHDPGDEDRAR